jgi:hypothetical protein
MRRVAAPALLGAFLALTACQHPVLEVGPFSSGTADLSRPVFVGGTLMSGYRDGALLQASQETSVAALLSASFNNATQSSFRSPWLSHEGGIGVNLKPWEAPFQSASQLGDRTDCKGVVSLGPVKNQVSESEASPFLANIPGGSYTDFCIPRATTADLSNPSFSLDWFSGNPNPYFGRFATAPGTTTVMADVMAQNPTFAVVSTGWDEILQYAQRGATGTPPPSAAVFRVRLDSILDQLGVAGCKGAVVNLPPLEAVPFFTTIPWNGLTLDANLADSINGIYALFAPHIVFHEGKNGFVVTDASAPVGLRQMVEGERLLLTLPLDSVKCQYMGLFGLTIPDKYELLQPEVDEINALVNDYNAAIKASADAHGFAVADLNTYLLNAKTGVYADGVKFTTEFVSGNIYSLDGVTFTGKGSALVANVILEAINLQFTAALPKVQVYEQDGVKFP